MRLSHPSDRYRLLRTHYTIQLFTVNRPTPANTAFFYYMPSGETVFKMRERRDNSRDLSTETQLDFPNKLPKMAFLSQEWRLALVRQDDDANWAKPRANILPVVRPIVYKDAVIAVRRTIRG
jgi:hypothetical protein